MPHFALYLVEGLCVEGVALLFARSGRTASDRPVIFGAAAGAAIGTFGLAAEWGWSHLWMVHPWPANLLPEGAILAFVMAVAAGTIGGFVGRALTLRGDEAGTGALLGAARRGAAALAVVLYRAADLARRRAHVRDAEARRSDAPSQSHGDGDDQARAARRPRTRRAGSR